MSIQTDSPSLITSHQLDLVYAAALRQTRDPNTAEDITQAAMILLLKKTRAGQAPPLRFLSAWLLTTTHYLVKASRRRSLRRQTHELRAASQNNPTPNESPQHLPDIRDALDTALLKIPRLDRDLIAQRYLQERPLPEIARDLNLSENTTTKRLSRALEKLRHTLNRSGVSTGTPALLLSLQQQSMTQAPTLLTPMIPSNSARFLARHLIRRFAFLKVAILACIVATGSFVTFVFIATSSITPATKVATTQSDGWDFPSLVTVTKTLEPPSDKLLAELLKGIADNRAKLKTISVQSAVTGEQSDPDKLIWNDANSVEGQGWIDTGPPRRFRYEITDFTIFSSRDSFIETWDGMKLRRLHRPLLTESRVDIDDRPLSITNDAICGIVFSTQLRQDAGIYDSGTMLIYDTFDAAVLNALQRRGVLAAQRVMMNGQESVQLTISEGSEKQRFWFDPQKDFSLAGFAISMKDIIDYTAVIDQLAQPAPGIFYPLEAHDLQRRKDVATNVQHFYRRHFLATKITANIPIDPAQFQLQFPPNIPITTQGPHTRPTSQPSTLP